MPRGAGTCRGLQHYAAAYHTLGFGRSFSSGLFSECGSCSSCSGLLLGLTLLEVVHPARNAQLAAIRERNPPAFEAWLEISDGQLSGAKVMPAATSQATVTT